jgi:hypothetical protein
LGAGRVKRAVLLAVMLAAAAAAQDFQINPVPQTLIEDRLRSFSNNNIKREETLKKLFEDAGCADDALSEHPVKHVRAPNVVCNHPGSLPSTIVVGAHFDMVDVGFGVVDNWSGASLLPSLFQALGASKHTFLFAGFTGEEIGLLGSKALIEEIDRSKIRAMINMDTLGLSDTKVWTSHADVTLVKWLSATATGMKLPVSTVNVEKVGSADSETFREKKIPAITIHSLTQPTLRILHSPLDTIKEIDMDAYYRTYRLVLGYLQVLDQNLE